ncbi:MAG: hypothetical protein AMJ88_15360 [Anaerolineae bacterium SM23_ 63]|nr:MAG: hypothetical protein AMJ88_15360 [Anaerolineae bacterium SM23_ 63]
MRWRPPGESASASCSAAASPYSATGAHRRLGQHTEDTHLSLRLGPLTISGLQVRVLGLAFDQRLLPLGLALPEVDRQIPPWILRVAQHGGASEARAPCEQLAPRAAWAVRQLELASGLLLDDEASNSLCSSGALLLAVERL